MKIKIKNINDCVKEMTITIDEKTAREDYQKVLNNFKKYVNLPGFRKGKAPISMIEKTYGEHAKEEFFNKKIGDYYEKALNEKKEKPINMGEPTNIEWEKGKELVATFKFEVMPKIDIEKYTDLKVNFEETKFKNEMIYATLEDYRKQLANEIDADIAKKEDKITATVKFLDEEKKVTKEIDRSFILGKSPYSKAFENKVIGGKVGDEFKSKLFTQKQKSEDKDIGTDFKSKEFLIEIKAIKRKDLPKINDEFAKDLEYDSLKNLKTSIEKQLKDKLEKENIQRMKDSIFAKIIEENKFDLPDSMVNNYAKNIAEPYAKQYGVEVEKLLPMYEHLALHNMKSHYIMQDIKKKEKIIATDEDVENIIKEAAENLNMKVDEYKKMYKKEIESDEFKFLAEEKKIVNFLKESSKFINIPKKEKEEK